MSRIYAQLAGYPFRFRLPASAEAALLPRLIALEATEPRFALLHSYGHRGPYSRFDWLCGWGAHRQLDAGDKPFTRLRQFHQEKPSWLLGHLSYELRHQLEKLPARHPHTFGLPQLSFFEPETLLFRRGAHLYVGSHRYASAEQLRQALPEAAPVGAPSSLPAFSFGQGPNEYQQAVEALRQELQYGSIYEVNYCQEATAKGPLEAPALFRYLGPRHAAPFSALYRWKEVDLLCFSPERYLQKQGRRLISQPIKGTAPRGHSPAEDQRLRHELANSEKERAENIMIVDLVRNDLSRTAAPGSVRVEELCGIYPFPAVHQQISTVASRLDAAFHFSDALATSFPMGSMTGAPKVSAMQLIDQLETFNRELYSGAVGYINPQGDLDLNVVIRSILHHRGQQHSSLRVGSAITIHCQPEAEYQECLLKAEKLTAQRATLTAG